MFFFHRQRARFLGKKLDFLEAEWWGMMGGAGGIGGRINPTSSYIFLTILLS